MTGPQQLRIAQIPLTRLRTNQINPRIELGDLTELAESLKASGQLQAIEVRRLGGGYFEITDGHRRFGAAFLAGLRSLKAEIVDKTDAEVMATMLTTGVHARPLSAAERRRAVLYLLDEAHMPVVQIAAKVGVSIATVYRWRAESDPIRPSTAPTLTRSNRGRPGHARTQVGVRQIHALADRWADRVDEDGLAATDARELLDELRGLTAPKEK